MRPPLPLPNVPSALAKPSHRVASSSGQAARCWPRYGLLGAQQQQRAAAQPAGQSRNRGGHASSSRPGSHAALHGVGSGGTDSDAGDRPTPARRRRATSPADGVSPSGSPARSAQKPALRLPVGLSAAGDGGRKSGAEAAPPLESLEIIGDFARLDHDRRARTGLPEVVWGPGKQTAQVAALLRALAVRQPTAMATRIEPSAVAELTALLPGVRYLSAPRIALYEATASDLKNAGAAAPPAAVPRLPGRVLILSAGTADGAVAEEAAVTAELMGCSVGRLADVGVAGLHRLLSQLETVRSADVLIVAAGMDGALPSVVAGLVDAPVIAVPTSVGYGAAFGGMAALLAALTACAPGVAVVNIDNGFGAAMLATRMLRTAGRLAAQT